MKFCSYWLDTAPAFTSDTSGSVPAICDVAVVGGGFTGLSTALHLARQGIDVVVLESDGVAAAASGRNGGHCNNGLVRNFASVAEKYGLERADAFYRAFDAAVDTVEQVVMRENINCDFRRSGKIQLAAKPGHFEALVKAHDLLGRGTDRETALVPASRIASEVGSSRFHGGLVYQRSAVLHVRRFGIGLAEAAARQGVRIYEQAKVIRLRHIEGPAMNSCRRGEPSGQNGSC